LRERYSLIDLCRTPDLATEVTLQPIRRIEVDAAILFSDLLLPLEPMGVRFRLHQWRRTSIENRAIGNRSRSSPALRAARGTRAGSRGDSADQDELAGRVPLIGFAGAPFTLASYAIEGGHSNNFAHTRR